MRLVLLPTELSPHLNTEIWFIFQFWDGTRVLKYSSKILQPSQNPHLWRVFKNSEHPSESPKGKGRYAQQTSWHLRSDHLNVASLCSLFARKAAAIFLILIHKVSRVNLWTDSHDLSGVAPPSKNRIRTRVCVWLVAEALISLFKRVVCF